MKIKLCALRILLLVSLFSFALGAHAQEVDSHVTDIELKRLGRQLNVLLLFDSLPIYEIHENLQQKVLMLKFKSTGFALSSGQKSHLYNDPILEGIRFSQEGDETWVQLKARSNNLTFAIGKNNAPGVLSIELRKKVQVDPLDPPPLAPSLQLKKVRFGSHPPNFSRVTFQFAHSKEPRMFYRQDRERKVTTIRFSDTHPATDLDIPDYSDNRIRFIMDEDSDDPSFSLDANQTFITIESTTGALEVKEMFLLDPPRWVIDFFGEPGLGEPEEELIVEEEMSEEELKKAEARRKKNAKENRDRKRRERRVKESYNIAENTFIRGAHDEAMVIFQETYRMARSFRDEFGDEMNPLGIQSLFRRGDIIYKVLQQGRGTNYHAAIDAYNTAIRVADDHELQTDMLPHAFLQIGQSYRAMKFYDEANQKFDALQKKYPDTLEAAEANFWRAVGQVDRREWQSAINSFRDYMRAGASPKHLAATHYKMAEAYYNLRRFAKAKEGFDRARTIDLRYPENDPALLFHMGEAYYESADFPTAREVFQKLLELYPRADFSKLVALRLGDFLRDEGKEEEAIEVYRQATSSFQQDVALLGQMRIANIQAQRPYSDDYKKALDVYTRINNLDIESPLKEEALLRKGLTLTSFGRYDEAIAALEDFKEKYPTNVYVRRRIIRENIDENLKGLVDQHFMNKDYLAVVGVYKDYKTKYLSEFRFDTTLFQVGVSFQELGLFEDAIDVFNFLTVGENNPLKELSLYQEAVALAERGDSDLAKDALIRFIVEYPDSPYHADANKKLAQVYKDSRDYLEAIKVYEQTIRQYTTGPQKDPLRVEVVPELYFELADLYNDLGRHGEAELAYAQVPQHYSHPVVGNVGVDVPYYVAISSFLRADMLFEMQQDVDSLRHYAIAKSMYETSTHPDIQEKIHWSEYKEGLIHQRNGRPQKALDTFKNLMDKEGNPLWKRLATENHKLLTRQLAYDDYNKQ